MTELLTATQMRAIEQAAIDSGEVTGLELMERAGTGVVEAIFEEWPELAGRGASPSHSPGYLGPEEDRFRAVVLCGPGNNGGDGFVVARLLRELGWVVEVYLYGDADKLPPDARVNYERWRERGEVHEFLGTGVTEFIFDQTTKIFIDAVFGTGLSRPVKGQLKEIISHLTPDGDFVEFRAKFPKFVSVDIPSGICADSGRILGAIAPSDLTVTFHSLKRGHHLDSCASWSKAIRVVDLDLSKKTQLNFGIGIAKSPVEVLDGKFRKWSTNAYTSGNYFGKDETSQSHVEWPKGQHKFHHGHALILSGPTTRTGAARLAARGALRVGAGLVTIGGPRDALGEHAAQVTAIMLVEIASAAALADKLKDDRITSLCLGPGMGVAKATREHVEIALRSGRKAVLDADALTVFQDDPDQLFALLHKDVVLTPHGGEFARLFPDIAEKLKATPSKGPAYSKVDATREAAARAGCVVLFKGPDTVIAAPDGQCSINSAHYERSAPWLATAGSGDVLAGFITGLMARGFAPMQAAETGAWLHVECALKFGPGLIAEDIAEQLPAVFRDLGL